MSDILTAFSGAKRSDSGGRTVFDKIYGLKGNLNPVFAGADRPEFHKTGEGNEQACVEGERKNELVWSNKFDEESWVKNDVTPTLDSDGFWKLTEGTASDLHTVRQSRSNLGSNFIWLHCEAKAGTRNHIQIFGSFSGLTQASRDNLTTFDLSTGTYFAENENENTPIMIHLGEGRYFCAIRVEGVVDTGSTAHFFGVHDGNTSSRIYTGDGSFVYLKNTQVEIGNYPTLNIPTQGTPVTRLAPSPVIENALPNSDTVTISFVIDFVNSIPEGTSTFLFVTPTGTVGDGVLLFAYAADKSVSIGYGGATALFTSQPFIPNENERATLLITLSYTPSGAVLSVLDESNNLYLLSNSDNGGVITDRGLNIGHYRNDRHTSCRFQILPNIDTTDRTGYTNQQWKDYIAKISIGTSLQTTSSEITIAP